MIGRPEKSNVTGDKVFIITQEKTLVVWVSVKNLTLVLNLFEFIYLLQLNIPKRGIDI